jgi:hypothetical protein
LAVQTEYSPGLCHFESMLTEQHMQCCQTLVPVTQEPTRMSNVYSPRIPMLVSFCKEGLGF